MNTAIFSALAIGTSISVALADPMPPADHANDGVTTEAASQGPVALTEAEMDKVAAGAFYLRPHYQIDPPPRASSYQTGGGTNDGSRLLK